MPARALGAQRGLAQLERRLARAAHGLARGGLEGGPITTPSFFLRCASFLRALLPLRVACTRIPASPGASKPWAAVDTTTCVTRRFLFALAWVRTLAAEPSGARQKKFS